MNLNSTDMSVVTFCIVHGANAGDRMAFWGKRGAYVAVWEVVDRTISDLRPFGTLFHRVT